MSGIIKLEIYLFLMVTVRYCQLQSSNDDELNLLSVWRIGDPPVDLPFFVNIWSYFDNGLFLETNANYFFNSFFN